MRKIFAVIITMLVLSVSGCGKSDNTMNLTDRLHLIQGYNETDGLYYDEVTGIVYIWNGMLSYGDSICIGISPYYAYNGKPYRYDSYLGKLVMIEDED